MYYDNLKLSYGDVTICLNDKGDLEGVWFQGQKYFPKITEEARWLEDIKVCKNIEDKMNRVKNQLLAYERGEIKSFDLDLRPSGTVFQKSVWDILLTIPYGSTRSYGEIAKILANQLNLASMSSQAIGGAVGRNPIAIIIPCHRVLGGDGSLTGFAGGLDKKKKLLEHEGLEFEEQLSFTFE